MPLSISNSAEIEVVTRDHWGQGGVFDITLSASEPLMGWRLVFDYAGEIVNIWNARIVSQEGDRYVVENVSYNGVMGVGESSGFGFEGAGAATSVTPVSINDDAFGAPPAHHDDDDDVEPEDDDHDAHGHPDPMTPSPSTGDFVDITTYGVHHGTSSHTHHDSLDGGRTPITTEALVAYNALRNFLGLEDADLETIGAWAFSNQLTNNSQGWGGDVPGVGLYYAMQGAKVGWIRDDAFDPQLLADIQREARLGDPAEVMEMVVANGREGFAEFLLQHELTETFLNTLKMEPHYGGWMHGRTHGGLGFPDDTGGIYATAHDVNHLTVLSHDQTQPFMNDTFDWPQWAALDVPHKDVIDYFQAMATLGDPLGDEAPDGATIPPTPSDPTPTQDNGDQQDDDQENDDHDAHGHANHLASLVGDDGANRLVGDSEDNFIVGHGGGDTLIGRAGEDALTGGSGDDMLKGGADEDRMNGGVGDDTLRGGGDGDILKGGSGDDRLVGGADEDVLIAGKGRDVLVGGGGEDRFVFAANQGMNIIRDFEIGEDEIRIRSAKSFEDLALRSTANATLIEFQGTVIKLNGVEQSDLERDDFML